MHSPDAQLMFGTVQQACHAVRAYRLGAAAETALGACAFFSLLYHPRIN
jgi:hypothetical protein